ncbi:MAG: flippase-like domain-containing protein, partial [Candidatus Aenigmatarchaeota archaeon]
IYMLNKNGIPGYRASAIVATDTILEVVSIFVIIFLSMIAMTIVKGPSFSLLVPILMALALAVVLFLAIFAVIFNRTLLRRLINFIMRFAAKFSKSHLLVKARKKDYAALFQNALENLTKDNKFVSKLVTITFLEKIVEFIRTWIIFLALGAFVPFEIIIFIWSITMLLGLVPGLPGNLGLVEVGGISAFIAFGLSNSLAGSGIILDRFISFWFMILLGFMFIWKDKLSTVVKEFKV